MSNTNPFPIFCSVCKSSNNEFYISTSAMMHEYSLSTFDFYSCKNCESVFLKNPVSKEQIGTYYTDYYLPYRGSKAWGKYASFVESDDKKLNKSRVKTVLRYLPKDKKRNLLDLGCGKPDFLAALSQYNHIETLGVDFVAADWKNPHYSHLNLIECDWKEATIDTKFDVITAWHYLEHDYELDKTISRFYDLLLSGGHVIIEVPMFQGILQKFQKQYWQGWHTPRHISLFSFKSWPILFPSEKWKIVSHKKYGTLSAFTLWWLGYKQKSRIDWSSSMEPHFWPLVFWKVMLFPFFIWEKFIPFGVQTIILQKK